jgi:hypothetical protein
MMDGQGQACLCLYLNFCMLLAPFFNNFLETVTNLPFIDKNVSLGRINHVRSHVFIMRTTAKQNAVSFFNILVVNAMPGLKMTNNGLLILFGSVLILQWRPWAFLILYNLYKNLVEVY